MLFYSSTLNSKLQTTTIIKIFRLEVNKYLLANLTQHHCNMKQLHWTLIFLLVAFYSQAQTIHLSISNPQPRIDEEFAVELNIKTLKEEIFKGISDKVEIVTGYIPGESAELKVNVIARKKGINELGPLTFTLNGTTFTTNKISYEVIDPLPNVDNGLWFRKIKTSDSTFCIIIEQRIPAAEKTTRTSENSLSITTEPETAEYVKMKTDYSIAGLSNGGSNRSTDFSDVNINGVKKRYMRCFSVYKFLLDNNTQKVVITKDLFENLPANYKFEDIKIQ